MKLAEVGSLFLSSQGTRPGTSRSIRKVALTTTCSGRVSTYQAGFWMMRGSASWACLCGRRSSLAEEDWKDSLSVIAPYSFWKQARGSGMVKASARIHSNTTIFIQFPYFLLVSSRFFVNKRLLAGKRLFERCASRCAVYHWKLWEGPGSKAGTSK